MDAIEVRPNHHRGTHDDLALPADRLASRLNEALRHGRVKS